MSKGIVRAVGAIGGLTLISRITGFARDMLAARLLGAGFAADAFLVAFRFPNLFRRLFAEGAFSAAFVPMFSRALHGPGGEKAARQLSEDILSVFFFCLFLFTTLMMIIMPGAIWVLASGYAEIPGKFAFTVELTRLSFPYLPLISLVCLLTGILNAKGRFAVGAATPILFNLVLIAGLITGHMIGKQNDATIALTTARAYATAISIAGLVQLVWLLWAAQRAGFSLHMRWPRLTPGVRKFGKTVLPATIGAGIYQINLFVDTLFATSLPQGSMAYLNYADRLNQLPLGVIGVALGTAILPALSRSIALKNDDQAAKIQESALEIGACLTIPATIALVICATPLATAFYTGGAFTLDNAQATAQVLTYLVLGLPAYVCVKILTPAFYARDDMRTPVTSAAIALGVNVALNFILVSRLGLPGLAMAGAISAWLNCAILYGALHQRRHFRFPVALLWRIARQTACALVMGALLFGLRIWGADLFAGTVLARISGVGLLVVGGVCTYFLLAFMTRAIDVTLLTQLRRAR